MPLKFVDLFCGIGGFHYALASLGMTCVFACDNDKDCRDNYELNHGLAPASDIRNVDADDIPDFDVLCAGFPCQAYSHAGKQLGFGDKVRGTLFAEVVRILDAKRPKFFILENVKNLASHDKCRTWTHMRTELRSLGYHVQDYPICFSPLQVGIPQNRDRLFIVGALQKDDLLLDQFVPPLKDKKDKNLNLESVVDLDINRSTDPSLYVTPAKQSVLDLWEEFLQYFKEVNKPLPSFPVWTEYFVDQVAPEQLLTYPNWKRVFVERNVRLFRENREYLKGWLDKAKSDENFSGSMAKFEWQAGSLQSDDRLSNLIYQIRPSGIRVKRPNYSPALVAMNQIVYIGKLGRKLSPKEASRLQGFPESYKCHPNQNKAYKQLGNAVCVTVVEYIVARVFKYE